MLFTISQIGIFIFGATGIYLLSRKDKYRNYGYVFGILSQPFFFYATIYAEQWGMTILNCFYLYAWINGFKNHVLKK